MMHVWMTPVDGWSAGSGPTGALRGGGGAQDARAEPRQRDGLTARSAEFGPTWRRADAAGGPSTGRSAEPEPVPSGSASSRPGPTMAAAASPASVVRPAAGASLSPVAQGIEDRFPSVPCCSVRNSWTQTRTSGRISRIETRSQTQQEPSRTCRKSSHQPRCGSDRWSAAKLQDYKTSCSFALALVACVSAIRASRRRYVSSSSPLCRFTSNALP